MTTTTICELDGCTGQNVHGVRHAIATTNGIDTCTIYKSSRGAYMLFANIAPGTTIDVAHSLVAKAVSPYGVEVRPAERVSPVDVG